MKHAYQDQYSQHWASAKEIAKLDVVDVRELADDVGMSDIDRLLDEGVVRQPSGGAGKAVQKIGQAEKRELLRLLALGYNEPEIVARLNTIRDDLGKPALSPTFSIHWYRERYKPLLTIIAKKFHGEVEKACRFSQKFVRIRQLNDMAEGVLLHLNTYTPETPLDHTYHKNATLFLTILERIHKEMGITKYSHHLREIRHVETTDTLDQRWQKVKNRLAFPAPDPEPEETAWTDDTTTT